MTDPNTPSIERLHQDPRFNSVSVRTLEIWSREDHWVKRRTDFFEKWAATARDRMSSHLAQARVEEMNDLREIHAMALDKLRTDAAEPRSWEGLARVVVDISRLREEIRAASAADMLPPQASGSGVRPEDVNLTDDELKVAAREILRLRRSGALLVAPGATPDAAPNVEPDVAPDATPPSASPDAAPVANRVGVGEDPLAHEEADDLEADLEADDREADVEDV